MQGQVQLTLRYVDVREARPRWRLNAAYGLTDRLLVGIEVNPAAGEVLPVANWTLLLEDAERPMLSLGTSSDRIFSPEGTRSYYLTAAKSIPGTKLAPYTSLSWSEWEDTPLVPFGLNWTIRPQWDAMLQHDGRNTHWLLSYKAEDWNLSLLLVKGRHLGASAGVQF
ncbi:MAG: hypothetical protein AMXMBFR61_17670 [Fimbriimonadales bacterium]